MDPMLLKDKVAILYDAETGHVTLLDQARRRWRDFKVEPGLEDLYWVSEAVVALGAQGRLPAWSGRHFELRQALANFLLANGSSRHWLSADPPEEWVRLGRAARSGALGR